MKWIIHALLLGSLALPITGRLERHRFNYSTDDLQHLPLPAVRIADPKPKPALPPIRIELHRRLINLPGRLARTPYGWVHQTRHTVQCYDWTLIYDSATPPEQLAKVEQALADGHGKLYSLPAAD